MPRLITFYSQMELSLREQREQCERDKYRLEQETSRVCLYSTKRKKLNKNSDGLKTLAMHIALHICLAIFFRGVFIPRNVRNTRVVPCVVV